MRSYIFTEYHGPANIKPKRFQVCDAAQKFMDSTPPHYPTLKYYVAKPMTESLSVFMKNK